MSPSANLGCGINIVQTESGYGYRTWHMNNAPDVVGKNMLLTKAEPGYLTLAEDKNGAQDRRSQLGQSEGRGLFMGGARGGACSRASRVSLGGSLPAAPMTR